MAATPLELAPTQVSADVDPARPATTGGSTDDRLAAGARAGDYVVERWIGGGAMGEVYAGTHPVIGKRVAIKVLRRELAASPAAAERFLREARAVNQVEHANVVEVFACGRLGDGDGRLYLVMDLIAGRSLRAIVGDGALPPARALAILGEIAAALDAAHARGVVHRDLKPDNIMIADAGGTAVVLDFGIAKLIATAEPGAAMQTRTRTLTGQGSWLGTPGYMAPEQWSADGAGPASDRYALGVIAFELLTGALPFTADSVPAMMERHFRADIPAPSTRNPALPTACDAVIARALAKDPAARYPSAAALVGALAAAIGTSAGGQGARPATTLEGTAGEPRSGARWIPAAAGVGVLGAMVGVWAAVRSDRDPPTRHHTDGTDSSAAVAADHPVVRIDVLSDPDHAQVTRDGKLVGTTPTTVTLAPGDRAELAIDKPGYLPARRPVLAGAADQVLHVPLPPIAGFDGVWQLPAGELRALERHRDDVIVFKLDSLDGERHYYRKLEFEPTGALGDGTAQFAGTEELVDARHPDDPTCHVAMRVQYGYDPASDALTLRLEHVALDVVNGHCVVVERVLRPAVTLHRIDGAHGDTVSFDAPAGGPIDVPPPPVAKALPKLSTKRKVNPKPIPTTNAISAANAAFPQQAQAQPAQQAQVQQALPQAK